MSPVYSANNPSDQVLDRFLANIPDRPYASTGKNEQGVFVNSYRMDKAAALTMPIIQWNPKIRHTYMVFDIDKPASALIWADNNCPAPNMIVENPANGHAHLAYELANPVWKNNPNTPYTGRLAPPEYWYKVVQHSLTKALGADTGYTHFMAKNPLHEQWRVTFPRLTPYESLLELGQHLDLNLNLHSRPDLSEKQKAGRWHRLFDSVRHYAYRIKASYAEDEDFDGFYEDIKEKAELVNQNFNQPYPASKLICNIRSVSDWVWERYQVPCERPPREVLPPDEITRRQSLAAQTSNDLRVKSTLRKINTAITVLVRKDLPITQKAVAEQSGLSRLTIRRHTDAVSSKVSSLQTLRVAQERETELPAATSHQEAATQHGIPDAETPCDTWKVAQTPTKPSVKQHLDAIFPNGRSDTPTEGIGDPSFEHPVGPSTEPVRETNPESGTTEPLRLLASQGASFAEIRARHNDAGSYREISVWKDVMEQSARGYMPTDLPDDLQDMAERNIVKWITRQGKEYEQRLSG